MSEVYPNISLPSQNDSLDEAYQYCKQITVNHYENFPVASFLLPRKLRKHVYAVYAFARHADDLADETFDEAALLEWRKRLHSLVQQPPEDPIFIALSDTIQKFNIPIALFDALLEAFLQDVRQNRHETLSGLFTYCRNSANPVGRIILHLHEYHDPQMLKYSDYICTALQLTNFWQDVRVDLQKNRLYIPKEYLTQYQVSEEAIFQRDASSHFRSMMQALVALTREWFYKGMPLAAHLNPRLRWEIKLTILGGLTILDKIEQNNYDILTERPTLNKRDWLKLASRLFTKRWDFNEPTA